MLPPEAKNIVMCALADAWRKWRYRIKAKYYTPYQEDKEKLKQPPDDDRIEFDQWLQMVEYWEDEEVKVCIIFICALELHF